LAPCMHARAYTLVVCSVPFSCSRADSTLTPRSTRTRADVPPSACAASRAPVTGHVRQLKQV
jgi:hypothetical protein